MLIFIYDLNGTVMNPLSNSLSLSLFLFSFSRYSVGELAYTRSGDKADSCNVGVVARNPAFYPYLKDALSSKAVAGYFQHVFPEDVSPDDCVKR